MHKGLEKDFSRKNQREKKRRLYKLESMSMGGGGRLGSGLGFVPRQLCDIKQVLHFTKGIVLLCEMG